MTKPGGLVVAMFENRPDANEAARFLEACGMVLRVGRCENTRPAVCFPDANVPRAAELVRMAGAAGSVASPRRAPAARAAR